MPALDQILLYLLAAVAFGLIAGIVLTRSLSTRHTYHTDVRWRRRFNELQTEHELSIATLTKTVRHAEEKRDLIRQALDESEETIRLLSADRSATYDQEIADRNTRIAELKTTLSHARAMLADTKDHEAMLQTQVDQLQVELAQRDSLIDELSRDAQSDDAEPGLADLARDKQSTQDHARIISLHEHPLSQDLVTGTGQFEQKIRALETELQHWKQKYEGANGEDRTTKGGSVETINGIEDTFATMTGARDDLKQIRGIGPALESALNELGFFQYAQLARMGQEDIDQTGLHDRSLPGRIRRYNWVEQARKLQQSTPGHRPRQQP